MSLKVGLGNRSYPIHIGHDLLSDTNQLKNAITSQQVMVVTNKTIADIYLQPLLNKLSEIGIKTLDTCILPDGESYKTFDTVNQIFTALLEKGHNRQTQLVALGGGVIGDMTGFAAATYQRGVDFVQIPTTLLSQVDSSVGGKTGVNHPLGKNMIGAFYQPKSVLIDTKSLETLPEREISAGMAEVVKYALLGDESFLGWIEAHAEKLMSLDGPSISHAIARSCRMKAEIVAEDERESGVRALLNLGHTFGHAVESHLGYGQWLHGEAVGLGLLMAADLSWRLGYIEQAEVKRIEILLEALKLPTVIPAEMTEEHFMSYMARDKKVVHQRLRFILLKSVGDAFIADDVPLETLKETLNAQKFGA
ncbi:MAG: 3-dehydroquinate synthase [Gammaproteobacteria bacterium]|nr:3-dehydroquinate synthase [Gammaproteobacteria bacterium]HBF09497.1 3-dehydroquinate synthase [Gammaproteobacteria bacterium]|tara:strand:- start:683 stop:1774 length:1092 start_codon:yes stop_codon:yes gene_type:complete